jgi:hypothetical protein
MPATPVPRPAASDEIANSEKRVASDHLMSRSDDQRDREIEALKRKVEELLRQVRETAKLLISANQSIKELRGGG